jgi:predicted RNase H-like nuclease (RuvC/YqgF family)
MQNNIAENAMNSLTAEVNKLYSPRSTTKTINEVLVQEKEKEVVELQESTKVQQANIVALQQHTKHLEELVQQLTEEKQQFEIEMDKLQKKANKAEILEQKVAKLKKKLEDNNIRLQGRQKGYSPKQDNSNLNTIQEQEQIVEE